VLAVMESTPLWGVFSIRDSAILNPIPQDDGNAGNHGDGGAENHFILCKQGLRDEEQRQRGDEGQPDDFPDG